MTPAEHRMTVYACWEKARQEFPDDPERRKFRYVELMREQGHIVKGKQEPLPCSWTPGRVDGVGGNLPPDILAAGLRSTVDEWRAGPHHRPETPVRTRLHRKNQSPAESVAGAVAAGDSVDSVADDYDVSREQVLLACWWYAWNVEGRSKQARAVRAPWRGEDYEASWATRALRVLGGHDPGPLEDPPEVKR